MDQPVGQSLWDRQPPSVSCGTDSHGQPALGQTATMSQLWDRRSASFRTDSHDQSAVGQTATMSQLWDSCLLYTSPSPRDFG